MASVVDVSSLRKTYKRGHEVVLALDDISFSIDSPQIVAFSGPSGSGKTTLLGLLAGFDRADTGEVMIGGINVGSLKSCELDAFRNRKLGFVFQQFNLLRVLSALENVELALLPQRLNKRERRDRAHAMLVAVGLADRSGHRPDQLSGGQQQRVAIARALVCRPALIIADEPTGNLDSATSSQILALITSLTRDFQTTFIIATHDPRVIDHADRVLALTDGRCVG